MIHNYFKGVFVIANWQRAAKQTEGKNGRKNMEHDKCKDERSYAQRFSVRLTCQLDVRLFIAICCYWLTMQEEEKKNERKTSERFSKKRCCTELILQINVSSPELML